MFNEILVTSTLMNFKNSGGILLFDQIYLEYTWIQNCFGMENDNLTISIQNLKISALNDNCNGECFIFSISSSYNQIILYDLQIFSVISFVICDNNLIFSLIRGSFSETRAKIMGNNNIFVLNSVEASYSSKESISVYGRNNSIWVKNSNILQNSQSFFVFYFKSAANTIVFNNTIMDGSLTIFGVILVVSSELMDFNNVIFNSSIVQNVPESSSGFFQIWKYTNFTIYNCLFKNNYFSSQGVFFLYDGFNSVDIINSSFTVTYSTGSGAIFGTCCSNLKNITLIILGCEFNDTVSELFGNINLANGVIYIKNSSFIGSNAFVGNLIQAMFSNLTLSNNVIFNTLGGLIGQFSLIECSLIINNTSFQNAKGEDSVFAMFSFSNIWISNSFFSNFSYSGSFLFLDASNNFFLANSTFENFKEEDGTLFISLLDNSIVFSNISLSNIIHSGLFFSIYTSSISWRKIFLSNVSAENIITLGSVDNFIFVIELSATNINVTSSGFFNIWANNKMNLSNSTFENCSGGVIYINQAETYIEGCKFIHSFGRMGSVLYALKSNISMNGCILNGSRSNMVASAIYCETSSITINFTQFYSSSVTSLSNAADAVFFWKGDMIPSNYVIIFHSVDFENNRENLVYFEGLPNLISFTNSSFRKNKATILIVVQSFSLQFQSLLFLNNTSNDFIRFVSGIQTVDLKDCTFVNNTFSTSFFSVSLVAGITIPFYNFNTLSFLSNQIMGTSQGAFFQISYGNAVIFTNLTARDNLMLKDLSINVVLMKFYHCDSILINGFYRSNNFVQSLSVQRCFIYMYILLGNLNGMMFSIIDSTFIFDSGVIQTDNALNQLYLDNKLPILKSTNSNISIFNMTITLGQNITKDRNLTMEFNSGGLFFMRNCSILSNTSIFIQIIGFNIIFIEGSTFEITVNNGSKMGNIYIFNSTDIFVDNSNFTRFGSLNSTSGLVISTTKQTIMRCFISNSAFTGNLGTSGAAIYIRGLNSIFFFKNRFTFNKAFPLGGAFYLTCFLNSHCIFVLNESVFSGNQAELGGSIFLENAYSYNISKNRFINDSINAYLRKNSIMTSPYYLNLTQIVDELGKRVEFGKSDQDNVVEINNQQKVSFSFSIYDAANRKCTFDDNSLVWFSRDALNSSIQTVKGDISFSSQGDVHFPSFQIVADFNTIYNFNVQMNGLFDVNKTLLIKTRICRAGEYYEAGTCLTCPINSYSLSPPLFRDSKQEGLSSCLPCPANSICQGHIIAPQQDYWISPMKNSTLLLKCPSSACIYVDLNKFNGIVPCAEGQKGALCIVCEEGYTKDSFDGLCGKCETGGTFLGFMFMKLGFMLIFVSYQVYNKIFVKSLVEVGLQSIYIKIIRDHFNQVFLISAVPGGLQLDDVMSLFYQKSNNVVTGSTLSLDCFFENRMDMFYYLILSLTISPIYMQVFISLIFFLVFIFKLIIKKRVQFHFFLKSMLALFIVVCDTQYTSILGAFFKLFQCIHLDSTDSRQYLLFAPHVECYSDNHILYIFVVGLPCFLIWVIGLPIFYLFLLKIMRKTGGLRKASKEMCRFNPIGFESSRYNEIMSTFTLATLKTFKTIVDIPEGMFERDLDASLMLAFLYTDFKGKRYYWTSTIMIWKFVMCVIVNFIPAYYAYFTLFVFYCVLLLIYEKFRPYKEDYCMLLIKLSFLTNMISIVLTMFNTSNSKSFYLGLGIVYVMIQSIFFAVAGYLILLDLDLSMYLEMFGKYLSERQNAGKIVNDFGNVLMTKFSRRRSTIAGLSVVQLNSNEKLKNGEGIHETNNELSEKKLEMIENGEGKNKLEDNGRRKTKHKNVSFFDNKNEKGIKSTIIILTEPEPQNKDVSKSD